MAEPTDRTAALQQQGMRSLRRMEEQSITMARTLRPESNPVEDAFKPPDPLPHSFMVASTRPTNLKPKATLHVPADLQKMLHQAGVDTTAGGKPPMDRTGRAQDAGSPRLAQSTSTGYHKVRRWDLLPKHAWLMAAESGQAPGPGFRDVSPTRPIRPFGPDALSGTVTTAAGAAAPRVGGGDAAQHDARDVSGMSIMGKSSSASGSGIAPRPAQNVMERKAACKPASMSENIASFYSPLAAGLSPATLAAYLAGEGGAADEDEAYDDASAAAAPSHVGAEPNDPPSFMPLELFDAQEMEPLDRAQWPLIEARRLAAAAPGASVPAPVTARSRFRGAQGQLSWLPCEVLRHDGASGRFELAWQSSGKTKWVSRLNLLFDDEDEPKFHARVAAAKRLRVAVEEATRCDLYARNEVGDTLSDWAELITPQRERASLRPRVPGASAGSQAGEARWQGVAMRACLDELRDGYAQAQRLATLRYLLHSGAFRSKSAPLGLPRPPPPPPPPEVGVVRIPQHDFAAGLERMQSSGALLAATAELLASQAGVHGESLWLRDETLVQDDLAQLGPPCKLANFCIVQAAKLDALCSQLRTTWVGNAESAVLLQLQDAPEFRAAAADADAYHAGRLPRLLRQLALRMQAELQSLVLSSMEAYLALLGTFATPPVELDRPAGEWVHALPPATPALLEVSLVLDTATGELGFSPPLADVEAGLTTVLDKLAVETEGVPDLAPRVMATVGLEHAELATVLADDGKLLGARSELARLLRASLQRPTQLLALFRQFSELATISVASHLEAVAARGCSLAQYADEMGKWRDMADEIRALAPSTVHCRLLLVHCAQLQEDLVAKALRLATGVAELVVAELNAESAAISTRYAAIHERLQMGNGNAEDVMAMQEYLERNEDELRRLQSAIDDDLMGRLALLSTVRHGLDEEAFSRVYATAGWPTRVTRVAEDAENQLEDDRMKYQEQLRTDVETFQEELESWEAEVKALAKLGDIGETEANAAHVAELQARLDTGKERAQLYNSRETLFEWPVTEFPGLAELNKALEPHLHLWTTAMNFQRSYPVWMEGPFLELSPDQVESDVGTWWRLLYKLGKSLAGLDGPLKVVAYVKQKLDEFKGHLPLIQAMLNPGMRERHWKKVAESAGRSVQPNEMSTLLSLVEQQVADHLGAIQEMSETASKEYSLEKALDRMLSEWKPMAFECAPYRDSGTHILRGLDDIQNMFDDHIVKTQAMRGSPFVKPFENRVRDWEAKLISMQETMDEWLKCQSVWLYLEPIFSSEDIMRQMPTEAKRFTTVDRLWRKVMAATEAKPNVLLATGQEGLFDNFKEANRLLELVQKGLNDYLEKKRLAFARLFFLSNDELLQILSETKDPLRVQPHLKKCFEGINTLEFTERLIITAMRSVEGETVGFINHLDPQSANGMVEKWLLEVEGAMKESLKDVLKRSHDDYARKDRVEWALAWPGMIVLAVDQIFWTRETEAALEADGLRGLTRYRERCVAQLDAIVEKVRSKLTKLQRKTLGAMVTLDVHGRDVLLTMEAARVDKPVDFDWMAQLRYYYAPSESQDIDVRMITAELKYGFEYLGNSDRLVVTPLTDRCYRTLMGAMQLTLGGAPEGPAGTGKTETTKDLSKALARQCVVMNCGPDLTAATMGRFFSGLAQSGAWACFDEFNRIDIEVLSVVAQQLLAVRQALQQNAQQFLFEGRQIILKSTCGVFITMNPGYAGRTELPDNLKALVCSAPCTHHHPSRAGRV